MLRFDKDYEARVTHTMTDIHRPDGAIVDRFIDGIILYVTRTDNTELEIFIRSVSGTEDLRVVMLQDYIGHSYLFTWSENKEENGVYEYRGTVRPGSSILVYTICVVIKSCNDAKERETKKVIIFQLISI